VGRDRGPSHAPKPSALPRDQAPWESTARIDRPSSLCGACAHPLQAWQSCKRWRTGFEAGDGHGERMTEAARVAAQTYHAPASIGPGRDPYRPMNRCGGR
jgi:hypothetical protein